MSEKWGEQCHPLSSILLSMQCKILCRLSSLMWSALTKYWLLILTLNWSISLSVMSDPLWPHGLGLPRLFCPWDFLGKNTGVGSHFLLQEIFLTQGWNLGLLPCRQILYHLSHALGRHIQHVTGRQTDWGDYERCPVPELVSCMVQASVAPKPALVIHTSPFLMEGISWGLGCLRLLQPKSQQVNNLVYHCFPLF